MKRNAVRLVQIFGSMLAGQQKAFWEEALREMRNAGNLEANGSNLFAQLRIPYSRVPPQAQARPSLSLLLVRRRV